MDIFDIYVLECIGLGLGCLVYFLAEELPDLIRNKRAEKTHLIQKEKDAQIEAEKRHQYEEERKELQERVLRIKEWEKKTGFKDDSKERKQVEKL